MFRVSKIIVLTKTLIKGSSGIMATDTSEDDKKKRKKIFMWIMLAFAGVYIAGLGVAFVDYGYKILEPLGLEALVINLVVSALSFLVFFFGLFYIMSVFYFSKDISIVLPLPVKPGEIILAKFFTTLAYEYMVVMGVMLPAVITYGIASKASVIYYLYALLTCIFIPVVPLVLAGIIVMAIMWFIPAAGNKDRFSMFAGLAALIVALGVNFGMQSVMMKTGQEDFVKLLAGKAEDIASLTSRVFPGTYFANYALAEVEGWMPLLMMLAFIGISAVALFILYMVGSRLYLSAVTKVSENGSSSKKITEDELLKGSRGRHRLFSYMIKDIRILMRTPIFFMNNVLMNFLLPFIFLMPFILGGQSEGGLTLETIRTMVSDVLSSDSTLAYILLAVFGIVVFTCGTNGITESAISREGSCAYFMKIIPMSYKKQIAAKIGTGILISLMGAVLLLAVLSIVTAPPLWIIFLCIAVVPGAVLLPNITGMIFDLYMPKIKWDNEQKAVKQNMNVLYGILASGLYIAIIAVQVIALEMGMYLSVAYITVFPLVLSGISAYIVHRITDKCMLQLSA